MQDNFTRVAVHGMSFNSVEQGVTIDNRSVDKLSPRQKVHTAEVSMNKRSPNTLVMMSKKIMELKNNCSQGLLIYDLSDSLQKQENNILMINDKYLELYS